jgi:hypothetical protein
LSIIIADLLCLANFLQSLLVRRKALEEQEEAVRELEEGLARETSRKLELQV